jgi:hypothetical protein
MGIEAAMVPAAMDIYSAQDSLKAGDLPDWMKKDQRKELQSAVPEVSDDMAAGYELGLQTARVIIFGSAEVNLKKADPAKIL